MKVHFNILQIGTQPPSMLPDSDQLKCYQDVEVRCIQCRVIVQGLP